ncbi:MAG: hypothetical protein KJ645_11050 [Planctomycetes bacterium]|nr:hypothetical protein [Planctomycetota bacterium]
MSRTPWSLHLKVSFLFLSFLFFWGCEAPHNHIALVEVPSGDVAGVATERGILLLNRPTLKLGDIYNIQHVFGNGVIYDQARVSDKDEYLALLTPQSSQLNNCRFMLFPLEVDDEIYVGVLDAENKPRYLPAELYEKGLRGDLVICRALSEYPFPTPEGYGGLGLFAYRDGSLWLAGILTSMKAEIGWFDEAVYPFIGLDEIWHFLPDLKDGYTRERKPFRPDFIYGVERDGSGE